MAQQLQEDPNAAYVNRRRSRYMAQVLEAFEEQIEPHLPKEAAGDIQSFKGLVRQRINALASDAVEIFTMPPGERLNGFGVDMRDQLSPTGGK